MYIIWTQINRDTDDSINPCFARCSWVRITVLRTALYIQLTYNTLIHTYAVIQSLYFTTIWSLIWIARALYIVRMVKSSGGGKYPPLRSSARGNFSTFTLPVLRLWALGLFSIKKNSRVFMGNDNFWSVIILVLFLPVIYFCFEARSRGVRCGVKREKIRIGNMIWKV